MDMEPSVQVAVTAFVCDEVVPAALKCLVEGAPAGLDLRDATAMSAIVHMGALFKEAKEARGGAAGFVGAAALGWNCNPQVSACVRACVAIRLPLRVVTDVVVIVVGCGFVLFL